MAGWFQAGRAQSTSLDLEVCSSGLAWILPCARREHVGHLVPFMLLFGLLERKGNTGRAELSFVNMARTQDACKESALVC